LNDNQYAALVSWTYNIGNGNMESSDLVKRMNAGEDVSLIAHDEPPQWNKANGRVVDGLTRRRAAELQLFDTPATLPALPEWIGLIGWNIRLPELFPTFLRGYSASVYKKTMCTVYDEENYLFTKMSRRGCSTSTIVDS
jgi:hypothetical protein